MKGKMADLNREKEVELVHLLSSLRLEATPEASFEERFLYDLHEKVAREAVCRPARLLLWEHLMQLFTNFGSRKIACGASTLGIGALAIGLFSWQDSVPSVAVAGSATIPSRLETSLASLKPGTAGDVTCISVRQEERRAFTNNHLAMQSSSALFSNAGASCGESSSVEPVNMGLSLDPAASFPNLSTSLGL